MKIPEIESALRKSWSRETSYCPDEWSEQNPARGQCVVSALAVEKMQPEWRDAAVETAAVCQDVLGDKLHSVYVRGSPSRGEAIEGVSDLDLIVAVNEELTDEERNNLHREVDLLEQKYLFATRIETSPHLLSELQSGEDPSAVMLKIYSAKITGDEDLTQMLPSVKPNRNMVFDAFSVSRRIASRLERLQSEGKPFTKQWCGWMMRRILRSGGELVMEREQAYARDLYPCYAMFAKYYPDKEPQMKRVLEYALNPTDRAEEVQDLVGEFAEWLEGEAKRIYE